MSESFNKGVTKSYKFRELKVYSSTEWLADNKKKYRQVFDRYNTTYIYAELSFYNKLFDDKDWEVDISLKCYQLRKGREELTTLDFRRKVSKYDNIVYVREGWGNKMKGKFWKKGTYYWEAWINNEKVAAKYFYVEDVGVWDQFGANPYLEVRSLRLYEGPYDDVSIDDRVYYKSFSSEETRYIYLDIVLKNKIKSTNWQCELFTKFYNNARELKGQVIRLHRVSEEDDELKITAGWGSNVKGSWKPDRYTAELVFMDQLLAIVPFNVEFEFEEGQAPIFKADRVTPLESVSLDYSDGTFEEVLSQLENLIGLDVIKQKVRDHANYIKFLQIRKDKGYEENDTINVHSVFTGNPGTGKTTVAKMMGLLYKKMGLLTKGHVHEVDRVDLVGEYIGQTAPKVKEAIEKARGGVLFIDEAYSLARAQDDTKDFGREVIEILIKEMSSGKQDFAVIVAGYPKEMKHFIDSNPGLRSRFKQYFEFPDYLPQELSQIATYAALQKGVVFTEKAQEKLDQLIVEAYRNRDRSFGNARFVFDLIDMAKVNLGLRIMGLENRTGLDKEALETILLEDINKLSLARKPALPNIPIDEALLFETLDQLNNLIGLTSVKKEINELINLVRYYRSQGKNVLNNFYFHTVLVGNPGTGKTTVARLLAKIFKALGILERGKMIETDRQGLVAGYVGQTAIKTAEKIDEALGGVLFIDEAYALTSHTSGRGDFGDEAIQTLLKRMEDMRGQFFVFVAGYPENMDTFLKANPGFSSRFDKILKFEDYDAQELLRIAEMMFEEKEFQLTKSTREKLQEYFEGVYLRKDKYFGNARVVRNIVNEIIRNKDLRSSQDQQVSDKKESSSNKILAKDLDILTTIDKDKAFQRKGIGFK